MPFWRKTTIVVLDVVLAIYLVFAIVSFNKPDEEGKTCAKVNINVADEMTNGFLSAGEIKNILVRNKIYPWQKPVSQISMRKIEEELKESPFVNTAECYKTQNGDVYINVTQRTPVIRIKSNSGDDYYLDDMGREMPNSKYTSDLIIATGSISKNYARNYISLIAMYLSTDELWKNQVEQIHVLSDRSIELVPRVGNHILCIGRLPEYIEPSKREKGVNEFMKKKLSRIELFYQYGLSQAGWNKYSYINFEFDNQIICKRNK